MISRKLLSFMLISVFVCSFVGFSGGVTFSGATTSLVMTVEGTQQAPSVASPESSHRILPVSMLVYTQFVDSGSGDEWESTMTAINNTYGTNYYYTNLTDYTNLDSALSGYDILLIPEQEKSNQTMMQTIGNAWGSTLTNFVDAGGIVILLDFANQTTHGQGLYIYNTSGLMTIKGVTDYYPGSLSTLDRVNQSDALARGLSANWLPKTGTISIDTDDGTVVVDDGTNPIVVHKIMGKGHVVFLGFDLLASDANYQQLLGNAIRLHRHVVFDDSHGQDKEITSNYGAYAEDLVAEGFAVSSMDSFSPALLHACDVLVMPFSTSAYSNAELDAIESFVAEGGGLFLIGELGSYNDEIEPVAHRFGYDFENDSYLRDTNDYTNNPWWPVYDGTNLHNHSLTLTVSSVEFYAGTGIISMPENAVSIITTDDDGTSDWINGTAADGVTVYAASTHEAGRIAVATDSNFLENGTNADGDGTDNYYDANNDLLGVNTIRWLSAAGLKERIVLFDESNNPYYLISLSNEYLELAKDLTSNGYTVKWMTTFHPSFLNQSHVLFICDGDSNYTNSELADIKAFVAAGGGLFVVGTYDHFGVESDVVGNEFGIDQNNTGMLHDSDDQLGAPQLFWHNESNLGNHPITEGISRLESYWASGLDSIGTGTALLSTDTDDTCEWSDGGKANGVPIIAATEHQLGRVVYSADSVFLTGDDHDLDGIKDLYEHDNILFIQNIFQWLAENRAPVVEVTAPNGGEEFIATTTSITWTATDPNKDDVTTIDISYSANGGGSWTDIASNLPNNGSISWDASSVPDSDQYLIRVEATDYELTGQDVSDADFKVDNYGPTSTNVKHGPAEPTAADTVNVSANVEDISGVKSVTLYYTINSGTEQSIAMSNVAGTLYAVDFPTNFAVNDVVEYYIKAKDNNDFESTSSTKSFTVAAPPGIPGFELPVVALGLLVSLGILFVVRRKRR